MSDVQASSRPCECGAPGWRWVVADPDIAPFVQCEPCATQFHLCLVSRDDDAYERFRKWQVTRAKAVRREVQP